MTNKTNNNHKANETIVLCDEGTWEWDFIAVTLNEIKAKHLRISPRLSMRQCWRQIKNSHRIILLWKNTHRSGGGIIEELLEIDPLFDVTDKVVIITVDPTREDVIYFNELDLVKIICINKGKWIPRKTTQTLIGHILHPSYKGAKNKFLYKLGRLFKNASNRAISEDILDKISEKMSQIKEKNTAESALFYDTSASIAYLKGDKDNALKLWQKAIDTNPNFYRSYNNLIQFYEKEQPEKALHLMQKMNVLNNKNLARMVKIGKTHKSLNQDQKAEHYFELALEKDKYSTSALNELAKIKFDQGDIKTAKALLSRSSQAYKTAAKFNNQGIELVREGEYEKALTHYMKAQYVLPQQDKGPLIFFNIGLCYWRWGKIDKAIEFLKIALVKDPQYKKAIILLNKINSTSNI